MSMAFRISIIFLLLLTSCAQVTSLTGGERDRIAPQPIEKRMNPQNGATNFVGSTITIPFSEYVKLNNPIETIVMIPPHAKPKATLRKKTLTLTWEDTLQDNTTYSIYLNETIQDITESNDSLMVFVFSTGDFIDSLKYKIKVVDAFTNQPISSCFVGLYEGEMDSVRPTYFVNTDANGFASFSFLKEGTYGILAFEDKNKDMIYQPYEKVAFSKEKINLSLDKIDSTNTYVDSLPLRLFSPMPKPNVRTFSYTAPSLFRVGATVPLKGKNLFVNGKELTENLVFHTDDSLSFNYPVGDSSSIEFVVQSEEFTDTASVRLTKNEKSRKLTHWNNLESDYLNLSDTLTFSFSDNVKSVDTSLIKLMNLKDSSNVPYSVDFKQNVVQFLFDKDSISNMKFIIEPNMIQTEFRSLDEPISKEIKLKKEKDYGVLKLDVTDYTETIVLELLMNSKVVKSFHLKENKQLIIPELNPGNYTFRIVLDENENGKWDTGNFETITYPEIIHTFSEVTNVRANWDVDLKLERKF